MSVTHHCGRYQRAHFSRREMLLKCATGFGGLAFAALMGEHASAASPGAGPLAPKASHFRPRAKNVIFLYMDGGPSQVDTFDPKPLLEKEHGQPFKMKIEPTQFNDNGNTYKALWPFRNYGQSGIPVSDLFPRIGACADDLCVVRSMVSEFSEHTNANYFMHTGLGLSGRPSMGAWINYGLGTENQNLPGYVVLNGGLIPPGGLDNFGSGFLPATYQGSIFRPGDYPVANIRPLEKSPELQRKKLDFVRALDSSRLQSSSFSPEIEAAIANAELAFRMQAAVPELMDFRGESDWIKKLYGFDSPFAPTRIYAQQCLTARRLVQRGVRFIELTCPNVGGDRWDQHGNLKEGHEANARAVDQPIAALLQDLKANGLLDETIVLWSGEFGRTPFSQGSNGRDHNPFGFSLWIAGGGFKGGTIYGATDEYGYKAVENKVTIYDLHATILHALGMDHTRLTFRFGGRDMRLTDVHGEIIQSLLA